MNELLRLVLHELREAIRQDIGWEPITKAEFEHIRKTYAPQELDWKPVEEYPLN